MDMKRVLTGVVILSVLTGCGGGGGGLSAEDQAAQAAAAAQTIASAKEIISTTVPKVTKSASDAKTASIAVAALATPVEQQATTYQDQGVMTALNALKGYVAQAAESAAQAETQQALVTKLQADTQASQDLALLQQAAQQVQQAASLAEQARITAEKALQDAQTALASLTSAIKEAEAARRYTKLDAGGNTLPASAPSWACVKDNTTGLIWEMKTDDGGARDKDWRYKHMHNSGGYAITTDLYGKLLCNGVFSCDPYSYIDMMNQQVGLCGKNNWRLPKMGELGSIAQINADERPPHIERSIFKDLPDAKAAYCSENMITDPNQCGYTSLPNPVPRNPDGRIECNYQGVDFGNEFLPNLPHDRPHLELSIAVALRHYGEVADGKDYAYGAANWLCSTRLVTQ
ncbi:Protein of unknown function [Thiothrix caldifontis]|uniref:Lcl C-terminal domain-containing protein n=1 Tax=Thiothrix caldifontis TaxID=525918 RepID=A0A1H3Y739_9GAMM|nr:DUF1566 domain-containing protein [Thiothrix caldifontis]SEA06704.1 Protein of unknown function [Thiothrix caldifontis]